MKNAFLYVLFGHALFLVLLLVAKPQLLQKTPHKKIVVTCFDPVTREVIATKSIADEIEQEEAVLQVEEEAASEAPASVAEKEPEIASEPESAPPPSPPKPKPKPKQEKKKEVAKKKSPPKPVVKQTPKKKKKATQPPATVAKKEKKVDDKAVALMKEGLAKLGKGGSGSGKKGTSSGLGGKKIGSLKSEGVEMGEGGLSYESELAIFLKHRLLLPEHGDVKIKLTLAQTGKVLSVATVSSLSEKNRSHVEAKLPSIKFPAFDERMEGEQSHTFAITLKSD